MISPLLTTVPFGYNWTHPTSPLTHPWRFFSAEDLGANPAGVNSAALSSFREFESGGYVAVVLPFLSTTYLPEQRGSDVDWFGDDHPNQESKQRAPLVLLCADCIYDDVLTDALFGTLRRLMAARIDAVMLRPGGMSSSRVEELLKTLSTCCFRLP